MENQLSSSGIFPKTYFIGILPEDPKRSARSKHCTNTCLYVYMYTQKGIHMNLYAVEIVENVEGTLMCIHFTCVWAFC